MAKLLVDGSLLHLQPSLAEQVLDLRRGAFNLPLEAVVRVEVVNKPWGPDGFSGGVAFGVTANGAPARALLTVSSRATVKQGRAAVYVYLNRRSVQVDLDPLRSQFARVVISAVHPEVIAAQITRALAELE